MNPNDIQQERDQSRNLIVEAWRKFKAHKSLEPLERQIVSIIEQHPEFHASFDQEVLLNIDYPMDLTINPFLHIGLHLSILEQLSINQPEGIRDLYNKLTLQIGNVHDAEHLIMQALLSALDVSLYDPSSSPEQHYLSSLNELLRQ